MFKSVSMVFNCWLSRWSEISDPLTLSWPVGGRDCRWFLRRPNRRAAAGIGHIRDCLYAATRPAESSVDRDCSAWCSWLRLRDPSMSAIQSIAIVTNSINLQVEFDNTAIKRCQVIKTLKDMYMYNVHCTCMCTYLKMAMLSLINKLIDTIAAEWGRLYDERSTLTSNKDNRTAKHERTRGFRSCQAFIEPQPKQLLCRCSCNVVNSTLVNRLLCIVLVLEKLDYYRCVVPERIIRAAMRTNSTISSEVFCLLNRVGHCVQLASIVSAFANVDKVHEILVYSFCFSCAGVPMTKLLQGRRQFTLKLEAHTHLAN